MIRRMITIFVPAMACVFFSGCSLLMDDYKKVDSLDSDSGDTDSGDTDSDSTEDSGSDSDSSSNPPPVLTADGDTDGVEGTTVAFTVTAQDPDDQDVLLSLDEGPDGAVFDPETGAFSWEIPFSAVDHAGRTADVIARFSGTDDGSPAATGTLDVSLLVFSDADEDALADDADNCPLESNPEQVDYDSDGVGVVCDPWIPLPADMFDLRTDSDYDNGTLRMTGNNAAVLVSSYPNDTTAFGHNRHQGLFIEANESVSEFPTLPMVETSDYLNMEMAGDGALWLGRTAVASSIKSWSRTEAGVEEPVNRDDYLFWSHSDQSVLLYTMATLERWQGMMSEELVNGMTSINPFRIGDTTFIETQESPFGTTLYGLHTLGPDGTFATVTTGAASYRSFGAIGDYLLTCHREGNVDRLSFWQEDVAALTIDITTDAQCSDLGMESIYKPVDTGSPLETDGDHLWFSAVHPDTTVSMVRCSLSAETCIDLGSLPISDNSRLEVHESGANRYVINDTHLLYMADYEATLEDTGVIVDYSRWYTGSAAGTLTWTMWNGTDGYDVYISRGYETFSLWIPSVDGYPAVVPSKSGEYWWHIPIDGTQYGFFHCRIEDNFPSEVVCTDTYYRTTSSGITLWTDKNNNTLVVNGDAIFLLSQGNFSWLRDCDSGFQVVLQPLSAADDRSWWVNYLTTGNRWNLARWRGADFVDISTNQDSSSEGLRSGVDGTAALSLQDALGWKLGVARGQTLEETVTGLDEKPIFIGNSDSEHKFVQYSDEAYVRVAEVLDDSLSPRLQLDGVSKPYSSWGNSMTSTVALIMTAASGARAWCPLNNDGLFCQEMEVPSDYPDGDLESWTRTPQGLTGILWTWPEGGSDSPSNFAREGYLARSYPYHAPSACCAAGDDPGCGDFVVEMCVCAQDAACCDTAWSDACVALVEDGGCGLCY